MAIVAVRVTRPVLHHSAALAEMSVPSMRQARPGRRTQRKKSRAGLGVGGFSLERSSIWQRRRCVRAPMGCPVGSSPATWA